MDTTAHDLKLLSIGYYIEAGIIGFYSLLVLGYAGFLSFFLTAASREAERRGQGGLPPGIASILTAVIGVLFVLLIAYAICLFLTGYWIARCRDRIFIYVMAALTCLGIPYGTVLGIFTFITMQRPTARQLFSRGTLTSPVPQGPAISEPAS